MTLPEKHAVLLFAKWPEPGRVKTRLAADIGDEAALGFYRCFVEDIVRGLTQHGIPIVCCYHPSDTGPAFREWLGADLNYVPQQGLDIGQRLHHAFHTVFQQGKTKMVALGSDSPDLPMAYVLQAFKALEEKDVVIGPCADGGYYLVGFSHSGYLPAAFTGIAWSSDRVFAQTKAVLLQHQRRIHILPAWFDVDTRADLEDLIQRNRDSNFGHSRTMTYWHQWS